MPRGSLTQPLKKTYVLYYIIYIILKGKDRVPNHHFSGAIVNFRDVPRCAECMDYLPT